MATYNINWQSGGLEGIPGKTDISLPQKTLDSASTSLVLTGRGVSNYGEIQQENFIRLMEHFASSTAPINSTIGQIWYNTEESVLYMRVDATTVANFHPTYYPDAPGVAWVQIWPSRAAFASLSEFSALALTINRIVGAPSIFGSDPVPENNRYGWGQFDLVPEYDSLNQLKAGFDPLIFPTRFDNTAWVLLLSRLRKALRQVGLPEGDISPVGFIDDGRPAGDDGSLANDYNDNPTATLLPDYTAGWGDAGQITLQLYYAATLNAISQLQAQRFSLAPTSSEFLQFVLATRTTPWTDSVGHTVTLSFTTETAANAYFNAGGSAQFTFNFVADGSDQISVYWQNWLSYISAFHFDYRGIRYGTNYLPKSDTSEIGFYDLTSTYQVVFEKARSLGIALNDPNADIVDSGVRISARKVQNGGSFDVEFLIAFVEDSAQSIYGSGAVTGTLESRVTGWKASQLNTHSPELPFPPAISSAIDLL